MNKVAFLLAILVILLIAFLLYLKKKKVLSATILFFILFLILLSISERKFVLSFQIKKDVPVYLLIDVSRSMQKIEKFTKWKKFFDGTFYFSDTISKDKKNLKTEFSKIYDTIRDFKQKNGECKIVVITDLQDNMSINKTFDPYNVYLLYKEKKDKKDFFIKEIKVNENLISEEPFLIEALVFSEKDSKETFEIKNSNQIIFSKNLEVKKGIQKLTFEPVLNLNGFKTLSFGFKNRDRIGMMIYFSKKRYKIFMAGNPSVEFVFLKRFLNQFKWMKTKEFLLKTKKSSRIDIPQDCNGYIFIDLDRENFSPHQNIEKLSNAIFLFTTNYQKNRLFTSITNGEKISYSNYYGLNVLLLHNNRKVVYGSESWKLKTKEGLLDIKERKYETFWFELISPFIEDKENFTLDRYNYIINEDSTFDTSKPGLNKYDGIPYLVVSNRKEDITLPIATEETNWMNIINIESITNIKNLIRELKKGSKVIQTLKIEIDFSKNIFFFTLILIMIFFLWYVDFL
ncbi:MAG: hypothetical protein ACP5QT_06725 [Brevinematia bacterium]